MIRGERNRRRASWIVAAVLGVSMWPALARSAEDEAASRALFAEGRRLAATGDYVHACPKFEDSYRLAPGIGNSFNLADCLEHLGRTASAWARFLDVAAATKAAGQTDREEVARARASALEPQLARLTIVVRQPVDGLVVKRDAAVVGEAAWGVPVPVDPGPHTIEATAPHKNRWSSAMNVLPTAGSVSVEVPALAAAPDLAPAPAVPAVPTVTVLGGERPPRRFSSATLALGAIGVVALTAGTAFGVKFEAANNQLQAICVNNPTSCEPKSVAQYNTLHDDATSYRVYEVIGFGMGAAAAMTVAYLWWRSAPTDKSASARTVAWPSISPDPWGLNLALSL
jgi:hypothetical protein